MLSKKTIRDFSDELASKAPVPGGGSAAALCAAFGAALGGMVCSLTAGKKKYAGWEADIERLNAAFADLRALFLRMAERDAEVFEPLSRLYRIPKDLPEPERKLFESRREEALREAAQVPLEVMRRCVLCLELLKELEQKCSRLALSDVGVAAAVLEAAARSAFLNVAVNTRMMKQRESAQAMEREAELLLKRAGADSVALYGEVAGQLRG